MSTQAISTPATVPFDVERQRAIIERAIAKQSFLTLATASQENRPLVAGLLYVEADGKFYSNTLGSSAKVRNIEQNARVAVNIPVRKLIGPPYAVQFQGTARILPLNDPLIVRLLEAGRLKAITSHGELELPGVCFIEVTPGATVSSYGLGLSIRQILRDPAAAGRKVAWR